MTKLKYRNHEGMVWIVAEVLGRTIWLYPKRPVGARVR